MALGGTYNTGVVDVLASSPDVLGTGVLWSDVLEGDWLQVGTAIGVIDSVNATFDGLTLKDAWAGATLSDTPYRILKMSWLRYDPALTQAKLREFINEIETAALFGVPFEWDSGITDADPGAGKIRANSAALASATFLYISKTSRVGADVAAFLAALDDSTNPSSKGVLILGAQPQGSQAMFTVGGVTDATNYIKLAISGASGVTSLVAGDLINFQFTRAGDAGAVEATSLFNHSNLGGL